MRFSAAARPQALPVCLQCGVAAPRADMPFCRRCGLPYGMPPREDVELPTCPTCYREADEDGRLASLEQPARRVDMVAHMAEHDRHPVGDDDWLESLREGDRMRIGRWSAPFDLVRRYLVTGVVDAGRVRAIQHDSLVTAMAQLAKWGASAQVFGDQAEWREARAAISAVMERYHATRRTGVA
jgi:Zn-finger nucleic acid-binding protein